MATNSSRADKVTVLFPCGNRGVCISRTIKNIGKTRLSHMMALVQRTYMLANERCSAAEDLPPVDSRRKKLTQ